MQAPYSTVEAPAARVVLLGASNLTLGLAEALAAVRARLPAPLQCLVAAGHGRSYGGWSRVLARGLPAILDCGLWALLRAPAPGRTYALLTDIGNDLAYGASPATLAGWVEACLERLEEVGAHTALCLLPAASLARLGPIRYHLCKALLFPGRRLPFRELHARVAAVNARLAELAARRGAALVEPPAAWYGIDRIHIRPARRAEAWAAMLRPWEARPPEAGPGVPPRAAADVPGAPADASPGSGQGAADRGAPAAPRDASAAPDDRSEAPVASRAAPGDATPGGAPAGPGGTREAPAASRQLSAIRRATTAPPTGTPGRGGPARLSRPPGAASGGPEPADRPAGPAPAPRPSAPRRAGDGGRGTFGRLVPERRTLCGVPLYHPQPCRVLPDGTSLWLF